MHVLQIEPYDVIANWSVPVRPVNETRPFSRGALILKAMTPLRENRVWPRETRMIYGRDGCVTGRVGVATWLSNRIGGD